MAGHVLIERHLAALTRQLPAAAMDELADGLAETYQHHLARGFAPDAAARAAVAEFGAPDQIVAAFTRYAPGRRTALVLLTTGPAFGAWWAASLIVGRAWAWPIPLGAKVTFGLVLLGVVAALVVAATGHHYRRTRLAAVAGFGLIALDAAMVAAALLAAPVLVWPMAVAIPASLTRIGLTVRGLPPTLSG